jgi:hypothetical protein
MITVDGRSDDGSAIVVSSNPIPYFRNSNATSATTTTSMTNTTNSSNTGSITNNTASVTHSGTMIRNRPSTTAMTASTSSVILPTDEDDNNVETPYWTTTGEDNVRYSKKSAVNLNDPNHITYNNRSISLNNTTKDNKNDNDNTKRYPVREVQFYIHGLQDPIVMNPMVSFYAILILWSVVIWTIGTFLFVCVGWMCIGKKE